MSSEELDVNDILFSDDEVSTKINTPASKQPLKQETDLPTSKSDPLAFLSISEGVKSDAAVTAQAASTIKSNTTPSKDTSLDFLTSAIRSQQAKPNTPTSKVESPTFAALPKEEKKEEVGLPSFLSNLSTSTRPRREISNSRDRPATGNATSSISINATTPSLQLEANPTEKRTRNSSNAVETKNESKQETKHFEIPPFLLNGNKTASKPTEEVKMQTNELPFLRQEKKMAIDANRSAEDQKASEQTTSYYKQLIEQWKEQIEQLKKYYDERLLQQDTIHKQQIEDQQHLYAQQLSGFQSLKECMQKSKESLLESLNKEQEKNTDLLLRLKTLELKDKQTSETTDTKINFLQKQTREAEQDKLILLEKSDRLEKAINCMETRHAQELKVAQTKSFDALKSHEEERLEWSKKAEEERQERDIWFRKQITERKQLETEQELLAMRIKSAETREAEIQQKTKELETMRLALECEAKKVQTQKEISTAERQRMESEWEWIEKIQKNVSKERPNPTSRERILEDIFKKWMERETNEATQRLHVQPSLQVKQVRLIEGDRNLKSQFNETKQILAQLQSQFLI